MSKGFTEKETGEPLLSTGIYISRKMEALQSYRISSRPAAILHFRLEKLKNFGSVVNVVYEQIRMAYNPSTVKEQLYFRELNFNFDGESAVRQHRITVEKVVRDLEQYASKSLVLLFLY